MQTNVRGCDRLAQPTEASGMLAETDHTEALAWHDADVVVDDSREIISYFDLLGKLGAKQYCLLKLFVYLTAISSQKQSD